LHRYRERSRRSGAARDRFVPRQVLLGVAFDAAGHFVHSALHHHRMTVPTSSDVERPASSGVQGSGSSTVGRHAPRRTYLDLLRGIAVLVMIEAHVIDSWTRQPDRQSNVFGESLILGGFGAPLFLFLAGVAVAMSAGSKARRGGSEATAVRAVQNRGAQIFLLAFLFRFQALVLSHGPLWTMLKVDILNVMGLAIVGAA